jgi:hypothetical protein
MNKYDLEHVVTGHARMSKAEWEGIYAEATKIYYTPEHIETILRRAAVYDLGISHLAGLLWIFSKASELEKVHPLQSGLFRRKYRTDRRSSLPLEPVWQFYPKLVWEIVSKHARALWHYYQIDRIRRAVRNDPQRKNYTDAALAPVDGDETETMEMFTHNEGARNEVARSKKIAALTGHGGPAMAEA